MPTATASSPRNVANPHPMIRLLLTLLLVLPLAANGENRINQPNIKTLVTVVNDNWLNAPIMRLNSNDVLTLSFDELSHDYHRYFSA